MQLGQSGQGVTFYRGPRYNREKLSCKTAPDSSHKTLGRISSHPIRNPDNRREMRKHYVIVTIYESECLSSVKC